MKVFVNLFLVFLIAVSLYVIPVNSSVLDLNFDNIFNNSSDEIEQDEKDDSKYLLSIDDKKNFIVNLNKIKVNIDGEHVFRQEQVQKLLDDDLRFTLKFASKNHISKTFTEKDTKFEFSVDEKRLVIEIDIQKDDLKLLFSNYLIDLDFNFKNENLKANFNTIYIKPNIKSQNLHLETEENYNLRPFYYNDKKQLYSIPIYRDFVFNRNDFATIFQTISDDMDGVLSIYGLVASGFDASRRPWFWYGSGRLVATLFDSSIAKITKKSDAIASINNYINSLSGGATIQKVSEIQFVINASEKKDIAGLDISGKFGVKKIESFYMPMFYNESEYLLVPFKYELKETIEEELREIISHYKSPFSKGADERFITLIPDIKFLEKVNVVSKNLKLSLSKEAIEFYNQHPEYAAALLDALSMSLTQISGVDEFEIWHGDKKLSKLANINIEKAIKKPKAFNKVIKK